MSIIRRNIMAVTSPNVSALYADIVGSLVPYYQDQVLLPNSSFIRNFYDITGNGSGNTIKIPLVNAYTNGQTITEGASISGVAAAQNDFIPTSVDLTMTKKGSWTDITNEAVMDGSTSLVRQQVIARLAGGISQAIDLQGFAELAGSGATDYGNATASATLERNVVMGPDSLAYGVRQNPEVTAFYNNDLDTHQFRATVSAGFKALAADRIALVGSSNVIGQATENADLADFQKAVSNLRNSNVLSMDGSMYAAFIGAATEYKLVSELNHAGAVNIPSLSELGNQALLTSILGSAVGCMFFRTNNLTVSANPA